MPKNNKREQCAAASRAVRQLQSDYRAEVMGEMLEALNKCENIIGMARIQGNLSDSGLSPVNDALISARTAIEKARRNLGK